MSRPSWDDVWMGLADNLSQRSTCSRASVGCVVVSADNTSVLAIGYNGGAKGLSNGCVSALPGACGHIHAEINALIKLNYRDGSKRKAYVTMEPCAVCAASIVNADIEEVVYRDEYRDHAGLKTLADAGIRIRRVAQEGIPPRGPYLDQDRK